MLLFCPKQPLRSKKKRQSIIVQVDNCAYNCTGGQLCTALSTLKIVQIMMQVDRPREEGFHLGETVARWRSRLQKIIFSETCFFSYLIFVQLERLREMMKEDDAAELIAKSADTTLGVIGGDLTDKRCLCLCLCSLSLFLSLSLGDRR